MSIAEVSRLAGVSIATVSRVVNNHPAVAPATADAVRRVMRQVNYTLPARRRRNNAVHSGLTHNAVALLFPDPSAVAMKTVLSGRLSHGINQALAALNISFVVSSLSDWDRMPACIENRSVDGVIIRGTVPIEQLLPLIEPLKCVTVFESLRQPSVGDQVIDDSALIGEMAAHYLIERGARQLYCLSHDPLHPAYSARSDAFVRAARFAGVDAQAFSAAIPHWELVDQFLSASPRPDGLFVAGDDRDATEIFSLMAARGHQVRRDFQFISTAYDPIRISALDNKLDYIDIQPEEIGRAAVELLMWRFKHPSAPRQRRLISPVLVQAGT
jgi:LacI family transcriptional regulator